MSRGKGGRRLNPQERALWDRVVSNATPMSRRPVPKPLTLPPPDRAPPPPPEAPHGNPRNGTRLPEDFAIGARASGPGSAAQAGRPESPSRIDRKTGLRLKRGKLRPEARLDLHGMTVADARPALTRFILDAHGRGFRLVLVITGKGREDPAPGPVPVRTGILRQQVPAWLAAPPLAHAVVDIATAHRRHGGSGAYYVYLRRAR